MKKLLLTLLCLIGVTAVWAADGSFNVVFKSGSDNNRPAYTATTALTDIMESGAEKFSALESTTSTSPGVGGMKIGTNKSTSETGSVFTLAAPLKITKIEVVGIGAKNASQKPDVNINGVKVTFDKSANASPTDSDFKNYVFTYADPAEVTEISIKTTYSATIKEMTVYYAVETVELKPAGLSFAAATADATMGQAFTAPAFTKATTAAVTFTSSTPATATVDATTGEVTLVAAGTTTIMATSEANSEYEAGSAQYVLTVNAAQTPDQPVDPSQPKPAGMAFSAATATATIGQTFTAPVLVKATDAAVTYSSSNTDVAVIDGVSGKIVLLKAGSTIVRATAPATTAYLAGSAEYTLTVEAAAQQPSTGRKEAGMYFTPGVVRATIGETFTAPVLSKETDALVFYTSNNTDVATVDAITGDVTLVAAGNAMITATAPATAAYLPGEAFYMLSVVGGNTPDNPDTPVDPGKTTTVVIDYSKTTNLTETVDGVTVIAANPSGNAPVHHEGTQAIRMYAGNTLQIKSDKKIVAVKFTLASDAAYRYTTFEPSVGTLAKQASGDTEMNWTGDANEVTFTVGDKATMGTDGETKAGQIRIAKIEITVAGEGGGDTPVDPPVTGEEKTATFNFENPTTLNPTVEVPAAGQGTDLDGKTFTADAISIAFSRGTNTSNAPRVFTSNKNVTDLRFYGDNTATISSNGGKITKIEFVTGYASNFDASTASVGTFSNAVWTGEAESVDFKFLKAGNYNPSCSQIKVTYGEGGDTPTPPTPGEGYATLAAWMAAKPAADAAVNAPMTAIYQNGKDLFVKEGSTYGFIYGDLEGKEYVNGDVIAAGATGKYEEYNGMPEFIPVASTFAAATAGTAVTPELIEGTAVTDANLLHYVRLESVSVAAVEGADRQFTVTADGATFTMWNRWSKSVTNIAASTDADIYGFIGKTKIGETVETVLFPTRFEDNGGGDTPNPPSQEQMVTFNFADPTTLSDPFAAPASGEGVELDGRTFTAGAVSITFGRGTNNSNAPRVFTSTAGVTDLRFYGDNTATINGTEVTITKIEFVAKYPANFNSSTATPGSFADGVWTGDASSIDFKFTKHADGDKSYNPSATSINVYYTEGGQGGDDPNPPTPVDETAEFNFADPTTLSDPFAAPASGEGVELDGRTFTAGAVSITFGRGTNNSNAPRVFTSNAGATDLRFYGDNTATVSGQGVTISKIEFVAKYASNFNSSTASEGSFADGVWTGEASSVDFKFLKYADGDKSFNPSCTMIRVTYRRADGIEEVVVAEELPVEYYTLQGRRIANPAAGQIVIRRQGNDVSKILVK